MNSVLILLNSLTDWKPYCETDSLVTVTDYLEHRYGERKPKLVINLSDDYGYNSEGYYCSLLAQARGHRVLPGVETLNKLESGAGIRMTRSLQQLCHQWIERNRISNEIWQLNIYFGTCREKGLEKIARFVKERTGGLDVVYGGGLKADNAAMLASIADIDGGLIGGASLKAPDFVEIVNAANQE